MTEEMFEQYRPLLFSIAYRMLGTAMDAEDVLQEAYLRFQHVPVNKVESPRAFLTTIVTRLCLNQLQSAQAQRESYIGPWLPEPVLTDETAVPGLFTAGKVDDESISLAFLVLMEKLSPAERAVFLLREVFDYDYDEIAQMVDKTEPACRQLFSRAKKHITEHRPRFKSTPEEHRKLVESFLQAVQQGEIDTLTHLLADEVTVWTDGGGRRFAALHPIHGQKHVAQFLFGTRRLSPEGAAFEIMDVNGNPALILRTVENHAYVVITFEVGEGKIQALRIIGNPDKLKHV